MSYPHNKLGSSVTNHRERRGIVLRAAPPISLYCQNVNTKWVIYIDDTIVVTKSKAQKLRELRADYGNLRDMIKDLKSKQKLIRAEIKAVKTTKASI